MRTEKRYLIVCVRVEHAGNCLVKGTVYTNKFCNMMHENKEVILVAHDYLFEFNPYPMYYIYISNNPCQPILILSCHIML